MPPVLQPTELADRLPQGDRHALSRAITAVGSAHPGRDALLHEVVRRGARRVSVIGVTGPPGAGKSTLVGRIVTALLAGGHRVGVLLVDPSSPVSGGAVLADRVRMQRQGCNSQLYVRSVASRGQAGGLSATTGKLVRLLDGWGASIILLETVGAGQGGVAATRATVAACAGRLVGEAVMASDAPLLDALVAGAHAGEADLEQAAASAARLVVDAWDSPGS
jgi:LAO/AO transport system kinase